MNSPLHRQFLTAIAILGGMGFTLLVSSHVLERVPKQVSKGRLNESSRPKPAEAEDGEAWLFARRAYPKKSLPPGAQEEAWRDTMKAVAPPSGSLRTTGDHWTSIGPASIIGGQIEEPVADPNPRVSGRIVDIAVDPDQVDHWYIAADTGGVWETTNGGSSWTPRTDDQISLAMNTITIAPSNPQILFATTRDTSGSLLKSENGGASWTRPYTIPNNGERFSYAALRVDPTNPNIVVAATFYDQNPFPSSIGLLRSTDGGTTFDQRLAGPATALAVNPQNFLQQYAAIRSGAWAWANTGVHRSTDGGSSWSPISGTGAWGSMQPGGAVKIAIAPSNPNTLYVVVPGSGMWKTNDAWANTPTWGELPDAGFTEVRTAMVDPTDASIFYIGEGTAARFKRLMGGSWSSIVGGTHVDQWALAAAGSTILVGNDGGLWASADKGTTWINKNSNLGTTQFYAGSLHPTRGTHALGGSQDNGTEIWTGNTAWEWFNPGDGGYSAFAAVGSDPDHNWLVSHSNLHVWKVVVTGPPPYSQYPYQANNEIDPLDQDGPNVPTVYYAPIRRSPNGNVVLAASRNLYKSTDFFTAAHPTWMVNKEMEVMISTIAFAPSDTESLTYAFGTRSGELWLTTTGGTPVNKAWKNLDPAGDVPNRWVTAMEFHPSDPNTAYVALSGYNYNTPSEPGHIFTTTNALDEYPRWTDVSPPVDLPINALAIDPANPDIIFAGADIGVRKSTNGGHSWTPLGPGTGMPNVTVTDLLFSPADGLLVAFTLGRGAFKLNAGSLQVTITPAEAEADGAKWNVDGGPFQSSGTILPGLAPGNHTVTFRPIRGYETPADQTFAIYANQTVETSGEYRAE